jgi:DNA-binding NarL/FixJ family response regulator
MASVQDGLSHFPKNVLNSLSQLMPKIRILLIEDNRLLRDGIAMMINEQPDMKTVLATAGGADALLNIQKTKAQVVLVDLSSLHKVVSLPKTANGIKVIGMGLIPTQSDLVELVEAGAAGFIMKGSTVKDFLATIRAVVRGENVLPPSLTQSLFSHVVEHALRNGKALPSDAVTMTKREREIIVLIADALSNKEIAERLNIATYTVKSHVHNILEKLALHSRLQISKYVTDDGRQQ